MASTRRWSSSEGARPNTVYLSGKDDCGVFRPPGWLAPGAVGRALDAVVAHLALDNARGGAQASFGEQFGQDLVACPGVGLSQRLRGKIPGTTRWSGGLPAGCG